MLSQINYSTGSMAVAPVPFTFFFYTLFCCAVIGITAVPTTYDVNSNEISTTDEVFTTDSEAGITESDVLTTISDNKTETVDLNMKNSNKKIPIEPKNKNDELIEVNSESKTKNVTSINNISKNDTSKNYIGKNDTSTYSIKETKNVMFERPKHPCQRPCKEGQPRMTCHYHFDVEWYYAMSKACYQCATNISDCYRPECIAADGVKKPIIVVNRQLPGPSIEVCLGDYVLVDVANHLMEESTSVHWHGHHQRGSPYMDGVPFISQCPIAPNSVFRYQYQADNAGTHFWHSHTGVQRGDGHFGSLIIRTPPSLDPHTALYDADLSEHVIVVLDWSHQLGIAMLTAHYQSDGDNKPESMIVNGRGHYFNDTQQLTNTPLEVFTVQKGLRYRFRLINAGVQNCPIDLSIDNHIMTVISSDGSDIKPKEVDSLVSYAGERWDFILHADAEVNNYWMRFTGLMDCDERFTKAHQVAILRYEGAPEQKPSLPVGYNIHDKRNLQLNSLNVALNATGSLSVPHLEAVNTTPDFRLKETPDQQIYISFDFNPKDNPHYHKANLYGFYQVRKEERVYTPQFDDITMKLPHFPLMTQYNSINEDTFCDHKILKNCNTTFCACTNVINIPLNNVVELVLIDKGVTYNANHPFHLHGHAFQVVGMDRLGDNVTVEHVKALDQAGLLYRNMTRPPVKDTITVPDGGYTILRFSASNPGYWMFHCHIEFHVEVGMALIFKVGEHSDFTPVPKDFPKCGDYYSDPMKTEKEINFDHTYTYNVTVQSDSEDDSFISFTHWWPSLNRTGATGDAVTYQHSLALLVIASLLRLLL